MIGANVRRVVDVNDRYLRKIVTGLGPAEQGKTLETGFDIAVASECCISVGLIASFIKMASEPVQPMSSHVIGSPDRL
jgi:formyltetrahydrofolate synthetase